MAEKERGVLALNEAQEPCGVLRGGCNLGHRQSAVTEKALRLVQAKDWSSARGIDIFARWMDGASY